MDSKRVIADTLLVLGIVVLAWVAWSQHQELRRLQELTQRLAAQAEQTSAEAPTAPSAAQELGSEAQEPSPTARRAGSSGPDDLARQIHPQLQARPTPREATDGQPSAAELDVDDPEVRMKLRNMIAAEREYQREQRWARRQERHEERVRERVQTLAQNSDLDEVTAQQVEDLLVVEIAEVSDMFRKAREKGEWGELRDKIGKVRRETDEEARALLGPDEFAKYEEMRDEEARRFGGRRDRRGDSREDEKSDAR